MSARKIERMLAAAGVAEGARPPYLTTARGMFATMAWRATHAIPEGAAAEEMVRNAHAFAATFWDGFSRGQTTRTHQIVGDHNVVPNANGTLQPKRGMAFLGGAIFMPSVRTATPVRHVLARDLPAAQAIADELTETAIKMLREELPEVTLRRSADGQLTRWSGTAIEAVIEGNAWQAVSWTTLEILNKSMDDLLHPVGYAPPRIHDAVHRRDALLRRDPAAATALEDIAERSMLPIRFSIAPYPQQGRGGGQQDGMIVLHGYGPGGEPGTHRIGGIGDTKRVDAWFTDIDAKIATQRRLHEQYGPEPSRRRGDWQIDIVSARMLVDRADGAGMLAQAIANGSASGGGMALRIDGRKPHTLLGKGPVSDAATWHGDEIRIVGQQLPDTVIATLVGRPVDEIVDSPLLKDAGAITSVRVDRYYTMPRIKIRVRPTMVALNLGRNADDV